MGKGNNCDEPFQRVQELQEENRRLHQQMEAMQRQMRVAGLEPLPEGAGKTVLLPGLDGTMRSLNTADLQRGYRNLAATMDSAEVDARVERGFDQLTRPQGDEGRFSNYDRILREVDISNAESYARLTEALGITHERTAPDDFALVTTVYGREKLASVMASYFRQADVGVADADLLARAAVKAMPALNAVENKVWLRFWADRTKRVFMESTDEVVDYMRSIPGAPPPVELLDKAFRHYRLALAMERHNNLVTRRHAQALRSQQEEILGLEQFRLDLGDDGETGVVGALTMNGSDVDKDSSFAKILEAVDNNRPEDIQGILDIMDVDGLDPKSRLDEDWFNTHMRMANALIKDSQLANIGTQRLNLIGNGAMMVYGPIQQTMENGFKLVPVADSLNRPALLEAARISAEAANLALSTLRATWKKDVSRVFQEGISNYSGNLDTYGSRLLTNQQEIADIQQILDMPYREARHWTVGWTDPVNIGLFGNKLQAAARILVLTKPGGLVGANAGLSRWDAAYWALGFNSGSGSRRLVRARDIETLMPWKPALRAMAAVDEVAGRYHFLFKLKAELEVRARMEGNQLGLFDDKDRAEWVQRQIDEAIYQATPSEGDVLAFRRQHNLKGSDFTNDEIAEVLAERNLAGAPRLDTPEAIEAMRHSAEMRFQDAPQGDPHEFAPFLDRNVMAARRTWWVDRAILPYWRSVFAGVSLDWRLASAGIGDTIKMMRLGDKAPPELVARAKASWTVSGALAAMFFALDEAGQVGGSLDPMPGRRNTLFGFPAAGIPVVNTLLLWKDLRDVHEAADANEYDGQETGVAVMKLLTNHIMRQWGVAQLQMVAQALMDGTGTTMEKLSRFAGFMASGQIPGIGVMRNIERGVGGRENLFRDSPETAEQQYLLGADDPFAQLEMRLRGMLADTLPGAALAMGARRKMTDHLGSPIGHIGGINLSRALPFLPSTWPKGAINEVVYGELDAQGLLSPPPALLERRLEGVAMSDELQAEYNAIIGEIKGDPAAPPSALLPLKGKTASIRFALPTDVVAKGGIRAGDSKAVSLPLQQVVDRVVKGRTRKEAFYALFTSELYRAIEDNPATMANPPGGLPRSIKRQRTAQRLIRAITDYYDALTQIELERRAAAGTSQAAKEWSTARSEMTRKVFQENLKGVGALAPLLNMPPE